MGCEYQSTVLADRQNGQLYGSRLPMRRYDCPNWSCCVKNDRIEGRINMLGAAYGEISIKKPTT
jgi:hypothetical protein